MKAKQMWDNFIQQHSEYKDSSYNAWSYGTLIDQLAELTVKNIKTAKSLDATISMSPLSKNS